MPIDREPLTADPDSEVKPDSAAIGARNRGEAPPADAAASQGPVMVRAHKPGFSSGAHRMVDEVFPAPLDKNGKPITESSWYTKAGTDALAGRPGGPNKKLPGYGLKPTHEETGYRIERGEVVLPDDGISGGGAKLEQQKKLDQQLAAAAKTADATRRAAEDAQSKARKDADRRRIAAQEAKDREALRKQNEQNALVQAKQNELDERAAESRRGTAERESRVPGRVAPPRAAGDELIS